MNAYSLLPAKNKKKKKKSTALIHIIPSIKANFLDRNKEYKFSRIQFKRLYRMIDVALHSQPF